MTALLGETGVSKPDETVAVHKDTLSLNLGLRGLKTCMRRCVSGCCDGGGQSGDRCLDDPKTWYRGPGAPPACSGSMEDVVQADVSVMEVRNGDGGCAVAGPGGGRATEKVGGGGYEWGGG